jgi:hypothetical protein
MGAAPPLTVALRASQWTPTAFGVAGSQRTSCRYYRNKGVPKRQSRGGTLALDQLGQPPCPNSEGGLG